MTLKNTSPFLVCLLLFTAGSFAQSVDNSELLKAPQKKAAVEAEAKPAVQVAQVEGIEDLKRREAKVKAAVKKTMPAVVGMNSKRFGPAGSGVVVSRDGLILSAAHVTQVMGEEFTVIFPDGKEVEAKILGWNANRDASMAKITEPGPWPFVKVREDELTDGDWVMALGHPNGYQHDRSPPVRVGRVGTTQGTFVSRGFLVTDCSLAGGDSGGPLFDLNGNLVGIHSQVGMSLADNLHVPMAPYIDNWDRLKSNERWGKLGSIAQLGNNKPKLGVTIDTEAKVDGALVDTVIPQSAAERAGVKDGDLIVKLDNEAIDSSRDLIDTIKRKKAGSDIVLHVIRNGKKQNLNATLGGLDQPLGDDLFGFRNGPGQFFEDLFKPGKELPFKFEFRPNQPQPEPQVQAKARKARLGLQLAKNSEGKGALVKEVDPGTAASVAGIKVGDRITKIDEQRILETSELVEAIGQRDPGDVVTLKVRRGGERLDFNVELGGIRADVAEKIQGMDRFGLREMFGDFTPMAEDMLGGLMKQMGDDIERGNGLFQEIPPQARNMMDQLLGQLNEGLDQGGRGTFKFELGEEFDKKLQDMLGKAEEQMGGIEDQVDKFLQGQDVQSLEKMLENLREGKGLEDLQDQFEGFLQGDRGAAENIPFLGEMFKARGIRSDEMNVKHEKQVLNSYEDTLGAARRNTVQVMDGDRNLAMGMVVHRDGFILTKASELRGNLDRLTVLFPNEDAIPAKLLDRNEAYDVALLKLKSDVNLKLANWGTSDLPLGAFVSAPGLTDGPMSIGVVSVKNRKLSDAEKGFLGVHIEAVDGRVEIQGMTARGAAEEAGLRRGDKIIQIDDTKINNVGDVIRHISGHSPDDVVSMTIVRGGEEKLLNITLHSRAELQASPWKDMMSRTQKMGGALSKRKHNFPVVLQTDLFLQPKECGGPVVDLNGNVIGMNIARAGRVKSYSIPIEDIEILIKNVEEGRLTSP